MYIFSFSALVGRPAFSSTNCCLCSQGTWAWEGNEPIRANGYRLLNTQHKGVVALGRETVNKVERFTLLPAVCIACTICCIGTCGLRCGGQEFSTCSEKSCTPYAHGG